jgi:aerobic-type carbon monoxide dehydrogenase small subunit (CoxS/CutS family)
MIVGAVALLSGNPTASDADIRQALDGHLCRCGTYPRIVQAVRAAGSVMAKEGRRG